MPNIQIISDLAFFPFPFFIVQHDTEAFACQHHWTPSPPAGVYSRRMAFAGSYSILDTHHTFIASHWRRDPAQWQCEGREHPCPCFDCLLSGLSIHKYFNLPHILPPLAPLSWSTPRCLVQIMARLAMPRFSQPFGAGEIAPEIRIICADR